MLRGYSVSVTPYRGLFDGSSPTAKIGAHRGGRYSTASIPTTLDIASFAMSSNNAHASSPSGASLSATKATNRKQIEANLVDSDQTYAHPDGTKADAYGGRRQ